MNKFTINNEYGYKNYSYLKKVLNATLKHEKINNAVFSIIFVDLDEITEINREYRGLDKPTDVISFAFEDNGKLLYNNVRLLGEIYICIPRMIEQAKEYGHSEKRELSFLAVHGLLHLLGYDHMNKDDEKIMFALQELILDEQNIKR
ncbi:MAG: rRNA maturation RNase YbeY [Bacilli bacterium]|nr:rRNA maturation RNase YbeY [Bacilli bacterium]